MRAIPKHCNEQDTIGLTVFISMATILLPRLVSIFFLSLSVYKLSSIPEDTHRILTLQLLDLRLNCINVDLPGTISDLHNFVSLNIR